MISKLIGSVEEKSANQLVINCHGVCYEVDVPISTAFSLPDVGGMASLFTHFVVREDAQLLFGFSKRSDRDMFRVLIKVNGVGPKLALTILSGLESDRLTRCVLDDDVTSLVKLPGIGKKTAERLLIELRDKVKDFNVSDTGADLSPDSAIPANSHSLKSEAAEALVALGYKPQDAEKVIKAVYADDLSLEQLIKDALRSML